MRTRKLVTAEEKRELEKLLRLGKTRKALAQYYGVSKTTIGRRIRKWGLVGIAKKGPRPTPVRTYRMTISSTWYDANAERVREYEMHFKAARRGRIRTVRRYLARRGVPYFQLTVYRLYGRWIPKRKVKVAFEREQPAKKTERLIKIEARRMEGKGRRWEAYPLPSKVLRFVKKKRKSQ